MASDTLDVTSRSGHTANRPLPATTDQRNQTTATSVTEQSMASGHLFGLVVVRGGFGYWRRYVTELGARFREAVVTDRPPNRERRS